MSGVTGDYKRALKRLSVPVVIVGQQLAGYSCVFHDDYHAFYDVTKLLLKKGRHKLGYISAIMQDEAVFITRVLEGIKLLHKCLVEKNKFKYIITIVKLFIFR